MALPPIRDTNERRRLREEDTERKEAQKRKEEQDRIDTDGIPFSEKMKKQKKDRNNASHAAYLAAEKKRLEIQALQQQKPKLPTPFQQVALGAAGKVAKAARSVSTAMLGVNTTKYKKYYNSSEPNGVNHLVAAEAEKAEAERAEAEKAEASTVFFTLDNITYACHIRKGNNREEGEILVEKGESYLVRIIESPA